jgi:hypothetical protein
MKHIKLFNQINENKLISEQIVNYNGKDYNTEKIHIDLLRVGDTIVHNGEIKTISGNNLKRNTFMGTTVFGDSYHSGNKKVTRVLLDHKEQTNENNLFKDSHLHILKGNDKFIAIGKKEVKDIKLPKDFDFSDGVLFCLGVAVKNKNDKDIKKIKEYCHKLKTEIENWLDSKKDLIK